MPKRTCVDGDEQENHSAIGLYSSDVSSNKPPFLARCSCLSDEDPDDISETKKRPFLGSCSGHVGKKKMKKKKYLHLVLNDWDRGYSIYRVDTDDFVANADLDVRQPRPCSSNADILAMYPAHSSPGIPVFDTETLGMTVCPCPLSRGDNGCQPLYATVGGKLMAFVYPFLEVLGPVPPLTEKAWSWASVQQFPPFDSSLVSSYAVHPDGRTIFMSVKGYELNPGLTLPFFGKRCGTFTFNIDNFEWTHIGDWLLPFKGQAHYDQELDAWVGLCLYKEGSGKVCCCDVPPATGCVTMPVWKLGAEVFLDENPKRHLGVILVYMGNSRFCLVESRMPKHYDFYPRLRVVKMTSFLLKYGKE
ncbi:hypothetical protein U9M48_033699 [Paspalum notatum var. saurae]|uniref:Uncharacterized protein n=1 Tax=Paspalum notatum var. saurae TaxID=547442 RepID=A0AAQ3X701_PASNO